MEKFFAKYTVSQILIRSFIALIAAGTFLLVLPICSDDKVTFLEAFFTATSATCVTGLMTVSALEDFNIIGQTIILFLIQVGGLGLMTFVTLSMSIISNKLGLKEKTFVRESLNKVDYSDVRSYLHMIFKYNYTKYIIISYVSTSTTIFTHIFPFLRIFNIVYTKKQFFI